MLVPASASGASTSVLRPTEVSEKGRVLIFLLDDIDPKRCEGGRLRLRGRTRSVGAQAMQGAARLDGELEARLPRRWLPSRRRKKAAAKARLKVIVGDPPPRVDSPDRQPPLPPKPPPAEESPPPVADARLHVGLNTNAQGWGMSSHEVLDRVVPTAAGSLREDFEWATIEPRDDSWEWGRYDHLLLEAARRGIRILPLLGWPAKWAGSSWNEIPADPAEFAEYTARVVARYGPGGSLWGAHPELAELAPEHFEIWNEPYLESFSAGGVDPGRYARLVRAAASAGRAANPQARYLLAADRTPGGDARHTFIDDMYAAVPELNSYFDAVAVHPYSGNSAPDDPRGGWGFPRLAEARAKLVEHGAADKPLWITEVGWSTCPENPDYCVSESKQARYLERMFELLRTTYSDYVRAVFYYHRTDLNPNPTDKEGWFGLERLDGSPKPAYGVFREAAVSG